MDRRDLLKLGALASVGGSGCASLLTNPGVVSAETMDDFLAAFDTTMASLGASSFFEGLLPSSPGTEVKARTESGEVLARQMFRSMFVVGTLQELPPEHLAHAGVQQRLRDSMGEMDDAVFGMTSMLESLSASERASVSQSLREDPNLGMRIMGSVDEQAAGFGVSLKQRSKLRSLSAQACARLKQSPGLAITEYTGKVRKAEARHGARAEAERKAAAAIGSALLWQADGSGQGAVGGEAVPARAASSDNCHTTADCREGLECVHTNSCQVVAPPKAGPALMTAGAIIMGVGLVTFGVGFVATRFTANYLGFAIVATVGAILGIIGLVVLIVGAVVAGNEKRALHAK